MLINGLTSSPGSVQAAGHCPGQGEDAQRAAIKDDLVDELGSNISQAVGLLGYGAIYLIHILPGSLLIYGAVSGKRL